MLAAALAAATSASSAGADPAGDTALHFWAMRGWADAVERELGKGVNPDVRNHHRQAPLHYAAFKCHAEAAHRLLHGGANPDAQDENGMTPLLYAMAEGWTKCVSLLLDHGADPNLGITHDGRVITPLSIARRDDLADIADLLLAAGAADNED